MANFWKFERRMEPLIRANEAHWPRFKTRKEMRGRLYRAFKKLWALGFKIIEPRNLKQKHIYALVEYMKTEGLSASEIQNMLSALRVFSRWIGKPNLVPPTAVIDPSPDLKRETATTTDKTWSGANVNIEDKIAEVFDLDERVGIQLALQLTFGMRVKESFLFRPHKGIEDSYIKNYWGTKNGRRRTVEIDGPAARSLLEHTRRLAKTSESSLIPDTKTLKQWRSHYYYICKKAGITKKDLGVVSHGLRHEYLNALYEKLSGQKSPIKGGPKRMDPAIDRAVRCELAERAGHSRPGIVTGYCGSVRNHKEDDTEPAEVVEVESTED